MDSGKKRRRGAGRNSHEARAAITKLFSSSFFLTILKESHYYNDYVESAESSERYPFLFKFVINVLLSYTVVFVPPLL